MIGKDTQRAKIVRLYLTFTFKLPSQEEMCYLDVFCRVGPKEEEGFHEEMRYLLPS